MSTIQLLLTFPFNYATIMRAFNIMLYVKYIAGSCLL